MRRLAEALPLAVLNLTTKLYRVLPYPERLSPSALETRSESERGEYVQTYRSCPENLRIETGLYDQISV